MIFVAMDVRKGKHWMESFSDLDKAQKALARRLEINSNDATWLEVFEDEKQYDIKMWWIGDDGYIELTYLDEEDI